MRSSKCGIIILLTLLAVSCSRPSKVWLHRANDIAKAQYFQDRFAGLEVDVHFVDSLHTFIVKHDSDEVSYTRLDEWFAAIERRSKLGFWIDFKNLDTDNMEASAKELARMREAYHLKGLIIVESSNAQCLKAFDDLRFRTSYYIPYANPNEMSQERLQYLTDIIRKNIKANDLNTISGAFYQYQFMKDSFPEIHKLVWYELYDTVTRNNYINLVNEDKKTDVILVAVMDTIDYSHELGY